MLKSILDDDLEETLIITGDNFIVKIYHMYFSANLICI